MSEIINKKVFIDLIKEIIIVLGIVTIGLIILYILHITGLLQVMLNA